MPQRQTVVTVGIPFHDARRTLPDAVRSVFAQTFQDWELILLDDGSTDGGSAVIRGVQDPRVRIYADNRRLGLAERLNQIARLAQGKYLARMDADDLMHPRRLQVQLDTLKRTPSADLVGTAAYVMDDAGRITGIRRPRASDLRLISVLRRVPFMHPTVMGRTEWFRRHPYDAAYVRAEDHELWSRTCGGIRSLQLQEPLLFYRHPGAGSLRKYLSTYQTDRRIVRRYGRHGLGVLPTALLLTESYARTWMHLCAEVLGMRRAVFRWRDGKLTELQRTMAQGELDSILATTLPGLVPPRDALVCAERSPA